MGLLDEIMGWACYAFIKEMAVTSDLSVKFHRPSYISNEKITVICRITSNRGSKVHMEASLFNSKGERCTSGEDTYHILPEEKYYKSIITS